MGKTALSGNLQKGLTWKQNESKIQDCHNFAYLCTDISWAGCFHCLWLKPEKHSDYVGMLWKWWWWWWWWWYKKTTTKPSINKNTDLCKHTNVTFWHWCRTIQLNLIMYTHRAILRGVFLPVSKPHSHSANLHSSFSQRCLHKEMVREMGLMESNSILRQIHISQQLMDWLMGLRLHFLREDLYQKQ